MGRKITRFHVSLVLISYVMLSLYWINRLTDGNVFRRLARFRRENSSGDLSSYNAGRNATKSIVFKSNFEVNSVISMWKLQRLLQAEWNGENSTEDHNEATNRFTNKSVFDLKLSNKKSIGEKRNFEVKLEKTNKTTSHSNICKALASGNDFVWRDAVRLIKEKHKHLGPKYRSNSVMLGLFSRCEEIYDFLHPASSSSVFNSTNIQIAYSILLNRPADQTFQLLRAIYDPHNAYCLHVDIYSDKKFLDLIRKLTVCLNNIFIAPKRFDVAFPSSKRIQAHLSCFRTLLRSGIPWRYLLSLSGSIFPLRNNSVIVDYLKHRRYSNEMFIKDSSHIKFIRRTTFVHVFKEISGRKFFIRTKKLKKQPPGNVTLFRSDNAFFATREFAEFATTSKEAKELLEWSHDTRYPGEFFWATLNNMPGAPGGTPHTKDEEISGLDNAKDDDYDVCNTQDNILVARLTNRNSCGGKVIGSICIFNYKDLRWLLAQDNLFAAPFEMGVDRIILECLYQNLKQPLIEDHNF